MGKNIFVISPSKSLAEIKNNSCTEFTMPLYLEKSAEIVNELKAISLQELENLLGVSSKLARLNWERYRFWSLPFNQENSRQAILSFSGDVYSGLNVSDFSPEDFLFSQNHLRVLSGLYGMLRPLDLIQPYRLEMGSSFMVGGNKYSLYEFWRKTITQQLNHELGADGFLVNIASNEYFKVIDSKKFNGKILNIEFKENKSDGLKVVPILSKRARGLMARFAIKTKLTQIDNLKLFDLEGYMYSELLSSDSKWVFIR